MSSARLECLLNATSARELRVIRACLCAHASDYHWFSLRHLLGIGASELSEIIDHLSPARSPTSVHGDEVARVAMRALYSFAYLLSWLHPIRRAFVDEDVEHLQVLYEDLSSLIDPLEHEAQGWFD